MYNKIVVFVAIIALAHAKPGQEAPPPKAATYNVPSVAKVAYPGPQVAKSVETYSAPSIEKTTTITRSIVAPLNAPNVQSVQYSAPAGPVVPAGPAGFAGYGGGFAGYGGGFAGYGGGFAGYGAPAFAPGYGNYGYAFAAPAPVAYAAPAPVTKAYSVPTPSFGSPVSLGGSLGAYAPGANYGGIGGATVYSAPSLGYSIGAPVAAYKAAAVPFAASKYGKK